MAFVGTWIVTAISVAAAIWLVPGIVTVPAGSTAAILFVALVLALVNATVRPFVRAISLPLTVVTLGIFHFVVNALMLVLASWLSLNLFGTGIAIAGFGSALVGSLISSLVSTFVEGATGL